MNRLGLRATATAIVCAALLATPAAAGLTAQAAPDTPIDYPAGATNRLAHGLAFDTCTAPSLAAMRAWRASPYRTVNIYFGGYNRACQQPELSKKWVRTVNRMGFGILPTYLSAQPRCQIGNKPITYTRTTATAKGTSDARDAISQARRLGLEPGSALYADVEHFDPSRTKCRQGVQRYLHAWTATLHQAGYLAGAYLHLYSGMPAAKDVYTSVQHARVDAVWAARWDGHATVKGWDGIPNRFWPNTQRIKQYRGDHYETHGGVSINIDSNKIKAPVASVSRLYRTTAQSASVVRAQPSTGSKRIGTVAAGKRVRIVCQAIGERVGGDRVWNKLTNGGYVSDHQVRTPATKGRSATTPLCRLGFQTKTSKKGPVLRTAPSRNAAVVRRLQPGSMAWVRCQRADMDAPGQRVWNQIGKKRWVNDNAVTNGSGRYHSSVPRCIPKGG